MPISGRALGAIIGGGGDAGASFAGRAEFVPIDHEQSEPRDVHDDEVGPEVAPDGRRA